MCSNLNVFKYPELAYRDGVELEGVEGLLGDVVLAEGVLHTQVEPDRGDILFEKDSDYDM